MMGLRPLCRRFLDLIARREGIAALEFALILPFALLLLSLVVYGGQAFGVQRKVTMAAGTVANIFAQANNATKITNAQLQQILGYANLVLFPYDSAGAQVVVSQLSVSTKNGVTTGKVIGSWANANAQPKACGTLVSVPSAVAAAFSGGTGSVILGEVYYPFKPTQIYMPLPSITLYESGLMIPRYVDTIDTSQLPSGC